ncbi:hypothetical protein MBM_04888 [Drepanopeziza brunnea f. sp. 'multigermtubi' MB_m1]|uniref:Uncharacterized protein n=1 Tax=Marssonina brunnea f. sp. multigermtubi (strain MB_m1) TaxID=1072389 RepID=K1WW92_MARBU|nr:uncharacterized protein MBM_04888 [Drepanopeziza brunnea f. sp. 'multigermtubi' MB_m1]EKD17311.1 hypothetical protein MBM_04888 [Drepanopeziza brunnea f. sp. 'multigermtubi' MB_m1]
MPGQSDDEKAKAQPAANDEALEDLEWIWDENNRKALGVICDLFGPAKFAKFMDTAIEGDPHQLWEVITTTQGAIALNNEGASNILRGQLATEKSIPAEESIDQYFSRLRSLQMQLENYPSPPSDGHMTCIMWNGLPKDPTLHTPPKFALSVRPPNLTLWRLIAGSEVYLTVVDEVVDVVAYRRGKEAVVGAIGAEEAGWDWNKDDASITIAQGNG